MSPIELDIETPPRYTSLLGATTRRPTRGWFVYLGMRAG
ncbi:hypothetical protein CGMCC3_g5308 [Colletotrichum fructicola]|nr:uncharacterized protein CGMCC3_g5308 [Colletotrichum fructicola]KAE9578780.1 hypothetical protein CGMCC3_g5308 [Colletotrichum fructicola]